MVPEKSFLLGNRLSQPVLAGGEKERIERMMLVVSYLLKLYDMPSLSLSFPLPLSPSLSLSLSLDRKSVV